MEIINAVYIVDIWMLKIKIKYSDTLANKYLLIIGFFH